MQRDIARTVDAASGHLRRGTHIQQNEALSILLLQHPEQFRLHLIGRHLDRIHDQFSFRLQRLQIVGRDPLGNCLALLE